MNESPQSVIERLVAAMNRHDLDAYLDCFDPAYASEQPLNPDRSFTGRHHVASNWEWAMRPGSDFRAEVEAMAIDRDRLWVDWHWIGTRADGSPRDQRGVAIYRVLNGRIVAGRLYLGDVPASS
jgi:ketosteroid isomerase-like protein